MEKTKVAVYIHISLNNEERKAELLKHYEETIGKRDDCELVKVYVDMPKIRRSKARPKYKKMMKAAEAHKFDYIVTRSVTRISRDFYEMWAAIKTLRKIGVGGIFEKEDINTSKDDLYTILKKMEMPDDEIQRILATEND